MEISFLIVFSFNLFLLKTYEGKTRSVAGFPETVDK